MDNLLVGVLGHRNSGKSHTWNVLFGRTVKTGRSIRPLLLTDTEYVDVFLVSGSPEERDEYVGDLIGTEKPRIVLCSMQYRDGVEDSINYFVEHGFLPYVHWLNPGWSDRCSYADSLGLMAMIQAAGGTIEMRDGRGDETDRVADMAHYILQWASEKSLLKTAIQVAVTG
jgi:hypothetical protein